MKSTYLLPYKFKLIGWILFTLGLIGGVVLLVNDYESEFLTTKVITVFNDSIFNNDNYGFFKIIENSIFDEIIAIAIIIGGLLIGFSREKVEDEFIYKLRKDSLAWAIIFNYIVVMFAILFIYGLTFFHVLIFNMFLPLLFFILRFTFLKLKYNSNEE